MNLILEAIGDKRYKEFIRVFLRNIKGNSTQELIEFCKTNEISNIIQENYSVDRRVYTGEVLVGDMEIKHGNYSIWEEDYQEVVRNTLFNKGSYLGNERHTMVIYQKEGSVLNIKPIKESIVNYIKEIEDVGTFIEEIENSMINYFSKKGLEYTYYVKDMKDLIELIGLDKKQYLSELDLIEDQIVYEYQINLECDKEEKQDFLKYIEMVDKGTKLGIKVKAFIKNLKISESVELLDKLLKYNETRDNITLNNVLTRMGEFEGIGTYECYQTHREEYTEETIENNRIYNTNRNLSIRNAIGYPDRNPISEKIKINLMKTEVKGFKMEDLYIELIRKIIQNDKSREEEVKTKYSKFFGQMKGEVIGHPIVESVYIGSGSTSKVFKMLHKIDDNEILSIGRIDEKLKYKLLKVAENQPKIMMYELKGLENIDKDWKREIIEPYEITGLNYRIKEIGRNIGIATIVNMIYEWQTKREESIREFLWNSRGEKWIEPYLKKVPAYRGLTLLEGELTEDREPVTWKEDFESSKQDAKSLLKKSELVSRSRELGLDLRSEVYRIDGQVMIGLTRIINDLTNWANYGDSKEDISTLILQNLIIGDKELIAPMETINLELINREVVLRNS